MKNIRTWLLKGIALTALLLTAGGEARAQQAGQLGAGVILGWPIGFTGKYWINGSQAFDAGLGFGDHFTLWGDFTWHAWHILPQPSQGKLGAYASFGPLIETTDDTTFGIRTMVGLDYWVANYPIELFAEAGPVFHVTPDSDVDANGGIGIRFYFGSTAASNASRS